MPDRNTIQQPYTRSNVSPNLLLDTLKQLLSSITGIHVQYGAEFMEVYTSGNTWSRAARRKDKFIEASTTPFGPDTALRCRIGITEDPIHLEIHWVEGQNRQMFESFCSHVNRKMTATLGREEG
jgi:hypothetical protein